MITDSLLIEKREELKRRLASGEYKTLIDVFLEWFDRLIRKITRQTKLLPLWLITVILSLVDNLIVFGAIYIAGGLTSIRNVAELYGLGYGLGVLTMISGSVLAIATVIVINQSIRRIFVLWRDDILDATKSATSLQAFEDWLEKTCNRRLHFLVTILGGLFFGLILLALSTTVMPTLISNGFTFGIIIACLIFGSFDYQFAMVILLPMMLRRYDLKLFAADPATSELLSRLSGELGFFVYFIAFFSALVTLAFAALTTSSMMIAGILLVLFLWMPIITMFVLNQTSLSSIIRRAKWKTLNEIQSEVEQLQASKNFKDKETMEAINRLMDFHDRVKATRNSAIDSNTILNFINSLLLPLLAFLLGNLDKVFLLFARKP